MYTYTLAASAACAPTSAACRNAWSFKDFVSSGNMLTVVRIIT